MSASTINVAINRTKVELKFIRIASENGDSLLSIVPKWN